MAFHLPKTRRRQLVDYIVNLTGEPAGSRKPAASTEGEFARGACGSWQLAGDTRPERKGEYLAAYLGKGEPSQRLFRGKLIDNDAKPCRGCSFGGPFDDGKYDIAQGRIEGTASRDDRFFIANALKKMAGAPRPKCLPLGPSPTLFMANPPRPLRPAIRIAAAPTTVPATPLRPGGPSVIGSYKQPEKT